MESAERIDRRNWRQRREEAFADGPREKERMRRFQHFNDEKLHFSHPNTRIPPISDHDYVAKNSGPVSPYRPNTVGEQRFNLLNHSDEGNMRRYNHGYDEIPRFEELETDRAELIRKLDQLKEKLTRSCDLTEESKESFGGNNHHHHHGPYVQRGYCCNEAPSLSPCHHYIHYPNQSSYSANIRHSCPQDQRFQEVSGFSGPGFRRSPPPPPYQSPSRFSHSPYDHDRFVGVSHQPRASSCSSVHCCNTHQKSHLLQEKLHPTYPNRSMHPAAESRFHSRESLISGDLNSYKQSSSTSQFAVANKKRVRVWFPIAGGAPVFTCTNCFELLKLTRKLLTSAAKDQQKIKCGACSSIILLDMGSSGGQISSVSERIHKVMEETNQDFTGKEEEDEDKIKIFLQGGSNRSDTTNTCYEDCDAAAADPRFSPEEENSKTREVEDEKKLENESTVNLDSFSCEEASEKYSDNVESNKAQRSRQSSSKETDTAATEMDVSLNELPNSTVSQESEETMSKDDEHSKDIEDSTETVAPLSRVSINGHLIPVHEVKKAEELAGPIQPGDYWYDPIAGFWGVMGHPCLGIIMPNIGPFDYPMPSNCGAGNTGVYVNGRELYDKDLDLLIKRGLPHARNKSYVIDMSGKVIDVETGEELDSLGKLAPTVEKAKHGFGMKVPKYISRLQSN